MAATAPQFLIERYRLSYASSATVAQVAHLIANEPHRKRPTDSLLALANPLWRVPAALDQAKPTRPDDAVRIVLAADATRSAEMARVIMTGQDALLPPLPLTQREADALSSDFSGTTARTEAEAQESFVKAQSEHFRYLHFAAPTLLNDTNPLLSAVVLATPPQQTLPRSGEGGYGSLKSAAEDNTPIMVPDDGFLTARELCELHLSADLTFLSAGNLVGEPEHNGKEQVGSGNGITGLTWALTLAGSPSQIFSQWQVKDKSTVRLMMEVYAELQSGKSKDAALRNAALVLQHDKQHTHPYYWAAFALSGDWR